MFSNTAWWGLERPRKLPLGMRTGVLMTAFIFGNWVVETSLQHVRVSSSSWGGTPWRAGNPPCEAHLRCQEKTPSDHLPSGKHTKNYGKSPLEQLNRLLLWAIFSSSQPASLPEGRVPGSGKNVKTHHFDHPMRHGSLSLQCWVKAFVSMLGFEAKRVRPKGTSAMTSL